jgi:glycosyltransferase involved in cell wall biosynthesis
VRVDIIPSDKASCAYYRLCWAANAVAEQTDWDIRIHDPGEVFVRQPFSVQGIEDLESVDLVVVQRVASPRQVRLISALHHLGIAVVVDADDLLSDIDKDNKSWVYWNEQVMGLPRFRYLDQAAHMADLVTVSTPALAQRYAAHGRVEVLRNGLPNHAFADPVEVYDRKVKFDGEIVVGWSGSLDSHPHDLEVLGGAVRDAMRRVPEMRFHVVGDAQPVTQALDLDPRRVTGTGWLDFDKQYHLALREVDIAIVPLTETRFNRAKCVDSSMRICTRRGFIPAGEIVVGDQVWRDGWKEVEATEHGNTVTGVRITTDRGYILDLTDNHRMMVSGEWVDAGDITPGSIMDMAPEEIGCTTPVSVNWPAENRMSRKADADHYAFINAQDGPKIFVTERWGRFLGAYVGDGSLRGKSQVEISCDGVDKDWIDLLMEDVRAFGMSPSTEEVKTFDGKLLRRRGVRFASAHLVRVLKSMGLGRDRENGNPIRVTRVPEVIWRSPRSVVAEFLAGYFEADGTTTSSGVSATSKDETLARDVQRLLLQFGITSRLSPRKHRAQNGFEGTYWHVAFGRAGADIFEKEIGFRSERKRSRLAAITGRGHSNAYRPIQWQDMVVSIEPVEINPVDIQVEGSEFIAAGFVSHNSHLKALEFSAAGAFVLASGLPEQERLSMTVPIGIARSEGEWANILEGAAAVIKHRSDLVAEDRAEVVRKAAQWAYANRAGEWVKAWERAVNRRKNLDK